MSTALEVGTENCAGPETGEITPALEKQAAELSCLYFIFGRKPLGILARAGWSGSLKSFPFRRFKFLS